MSEHNGAMEGMIMVNSAEEIDSGKRRLELTEAGPPSSGWKLRRHCGDHG